MGQIITLIGIGLVGVGTFLTIIESKPKKVIELKKVDEPLKEPAKDPIKDITGT